MRFVSFDDYEAGFFAFGGFPVGIIAIGGAPVGLVAIGILPRGVVALACGAGAGLVSWSCGVAVGVWAGGVGLPIGIRTWGMVDPGSVVGERPKAASAREVVALGPLLESEREGWIAARLDRSGELVLPAEATHATGRLVGAALGQARALRGRRVCALVRARRSQPTGVDYRRQTTTRVTVECSRLEDARPALPLGPRLRYFTWTGLKVLVVLMGLSVAGYFVYDQLLNLTMTRQARLTWPAQVTTVACTDLAVGTPCEVAVDVRTDGHTRLHIWPTVRCGEHDLYKRQRLHDCSIVEEPAEPDTVSPYVYRIRCFDKGSEKSEDSSGSPAMVLDTMDEPPKLQVYSLDRPKWNVVLAIPAKSQPRSGVRLFDEKLPGGN